jgi:hypothetical protein
VRSLGVLRLLGSGVSSLGGGTTLVLISLDSAQRRPLALQGSAPTDSTKETRLPSVAPLDLWEYMHPRLRMSLFPLKTLLPLIFSPPPTCDVNYVRESHTCAFTQTCWLRSSVGRRLSGENFTQKICAVSYHIY